jgi:hypothetical protein
LTIFFFFFYMKQKQKSFFSFLVYFLMLKISRTSRLMFGFDFQKKRMIFSTSSFFLHDK